MISKHRRFYKPNFISDFTSKQQPKYNFYLTLYRSDQNSNIFTKFDQNPTHSKRDISHKSGTDRQHTDRQTQT